MSSPLLQGLLALEPVPPCYWQHLLLGPHIDPLGTCPDPLFFPTSCPRHGRLLASCLLSQLGGKLPVTKPKWSGYGGRGGEGRDRGVGRGAGGV